MTFGKLVEITTDKMEEIFESVKRPEQMKIALIQFNKMTKLLRFGIAGYYDLYTMAEIKFNKSELEKIYYFSSQIKQNDLLILINEHKQSNETPLDVINRIFEVIDINRQIQEAKG